VVKLEEDALQNYRLKPYASTDEGRFADPMNAVERTSTTVRTEGFAHTSMDKLLEPYSHTMGSQAALGLRGQPIWSMSGGVQGRDSVVCRDAADARTGEVYYESKLACARGLIWATVLQISAAVGIAVCWELYSLLR